MFSIKSDFVKNAVAFGMGLFIAFFMLEIFLRIYNPFGFRVKGDKIIIYPYKKYVVENRRIRGIAKKIIHTKNSLGFRGEEPPRNFADYLTIIAVGGSTTECFYLEDGTSWPEILQKKLRRISDRIWVNNAGFDGQSTYGHLVLLRDYISKIKPKIVLFYIGLNDMGLSGMNYFDSDMATMSKGDRIRHIRNVLAKHSEVFSTLLNFYLYFSAKKAALTHGEINIESAPRLNVGENKARALLENEKKYAEKYAVRLEALRKECGKLGIEPVFITQAMLCADAKDEKTGLYLGDIAVNNRYLNCAVYGKALELYNDTLRNFAKKRGVFLIDAARLMPRNSEFYYDMFHFTARGSEVFAEIVSKKLSALLKKKYNYLL